MSAPIILASTSIYRKQIMQKLSVPFTTDKPEVDETPLINETPEQLVQRLAHLKSLKI